MSSKGMAKAVDAAVESHQEEFAKKVSGPDIARVAPFPPATNSSAS
jgi:hypothetical protein